jgi:hypothetical protein
MHMKPTSKSFTELFNMRRLMARKRIRTDVLPRRVPVHIQAGSGRGRACAVCDEPICSDEFEYEVVREGDALALHFHSLCEAVWEMECEELNNR